MGWFLPPRKPQAERSNRTPRHHRSPVVEDLEGRRLLSQAIQPIATIPGIIGTTNMISAPDGDLWIGVNQTSGSAAIDRIGLDGSVSTFQVPVNGTAAGFSIQSLADGSDGNVWFDAQIDIDFRSDQIVIGKITPSGAITEFSPIPISAGLTAQASTIISGPSGDLYFGYSVITPSFKHPRAQSFIGKVTTGGAVTLLPISSFGPRSPLLVTSLVAGPDGNLWFTDLGKSKRQDLFRLSPSGTVTSFPVAKLNYETVANRPDGNLIATGTTHKQKTEVFSVSTSGVATRIAIPRAIRHSFNFDLGPAGGSNFFERGPAGHVEIGQLTQSGAATSSNLSGLIPGQPIFLQSIVGRQDANLYLLDETTRGEGAISTAMVYRFTPADLPAID